MEDQVRVIKLIDDAVLPDGRDGFTERELKELADEDGSVFDCELKTALTNLCSTSVPQTDGEGETNVLTRWFPPGPETYVISERLDDVVNGEFEETVVDDREALVDHIQDDDAPDSGDERAVADGGVTVRSVVSEALDVDPDGVVDHLRAGELGDQVDRINGAIDGIENHDEADRRDTYGRITFRHVAYRYYFTEAVAAYLH
ncbi:hypothetical protein [Haloferax denitrificans]|uniref:hypothetical protein n=1 Tax=Haloferax denitrificans TaxID=35745 RepID=UPI000677A306|nr:hypothetical protein [Haloferax denitrificans]